MREKEEFLQELERSIVERSFVKCSLGKYRGEEDLKKILIAPLIVKGEEKIGFKYRYARKEIAKNYPIKIALNNIRERLGSDFWSGNLFTTAGDLQLEYSSKDSARIKRVAATHHERPSLAHNREKERIVASDRVYLRALGICNEQGEVKKDRVNKFKQINKFIEFAHANVKEAGFKVGDKIRVRDFGSGKSYLTFALYDFLSQQGFDVECEGIELREELVSDCNEIARLCKFEKLKFKAGKIGDYVGSEIDIAVALHACDTATDDAILDAVKSKAKVIMLAPCCHKYLRKRIVLKDNLAFLFKHGIHEEWLAATVTDSMRGLWLEARGYNVKIFEFVSAEYTHKNNMLTAVLSQNVSEKSVNVALDQLGQSKNLFGVGDFYLDR